MENLSADHQQETQVVLDSCKLPPPELTRRISQLPRHYTAEEKAFILEIVQSHQCTKVVPFGRVVPDWEAIAVALERFSGRVSPADRLKNYYHGELKDKNLITESRDKRERIREAQKLEIISQRIANRAKLSEIL